MKKIFLTIAIALFAVAASAQAPSRGTAEERAKASADHLYQTLQLDVKQYNKVYKAYLKFMRREDKRMNQSAADRKATESAIKSCLTPQQAKRFEQSNDQLIPAPSTGRQPLTRDPKIIPLRRDIKRSNMYIERD